MSNKGGNTMNLKVALVGNPNSGKTTLFNALTGANAYVGNWPGVTVEKKEGKFKQNRNITITDLPGIYSLSPFSLEEILARNYLINSPVDVIINIVDATNLERNLYLTTQLLETHNKVIIALNMSDVVQKRGMKIDVKKMEEIFNCDVIEISASKEEGLDVLTKKVIEVAERNSHSTLNIYSEETKQVINKALNLIKVENDPLYYGIKVLEKDKDVLAKLNLTQDVIKQIDVVAKEFEQNKKDDFQSLIVAERYQFINKIIKEIIITDKKASLVSDKIDKIVTNKYLGLPIFIFIMWLIYYISVQWLGDITITFMETLFGEVIGANVSAFLTNLNVATWLHDLIVDGIIGGVGAVLVFVPQLAILFLLLTFLEDSGYMARVAYIMDRIFKKFGLSGKSFIPLVIGTGCSVPAIMSTRTIENEKERKLTIMLTPFIPCSAKMPVFALFVAVFFMDNSLVAPSLYLLGIIAVILSGLVLKRTKLFKSDNSTFIMELPDYKLPTLKNLYIHTWDKIKSFIVKAGTIIFVASMAIWFLQSFNWNMQRVEASESILRTIGEAISVIFSPLGWGNWQSTVAVLSGFLAKETIVATFGIIYGGEEQLASALLTLFNTASAFSFVIFILLASPCFAAIGSIKREMNSWKWTLGTIVFQTGLAYIVAMLVYQIGRLFL
jgi:ferrous iron transport protein B